MVETDRRERRRRLKLSNSQQTGQHAHHGVNTSRLLSHTHNKKRTRQRERLRRDATRARLHRGGPLLLGGGLGRGGGARGGRRAVVLEDLFVLRRVFVFRLGRTGCVLLHLGRVEGEDGADWVFSDQAVLGTTAPTRQPTLFCPPAPAQQQQSHCRRRRRRAQTFFKVGCCSTTPACTGDASSMPAATVAASLAPGVIARGGRGPKGACVCNEQQVGSAQHGQQHLSQPFFCVAATITARPRGIDQKGQGQKGRAIKKQGQHSTVSTAQPFLSPPRSLPVRAPATSETPLIGIDTWRFIYRSPWIDPGGSLLALRGETKV